MPPKGSRDTSVLRQLSTAFAITLLFASCNGDGTEPELAVSIEKQATGDNQSATAGNRLAVPLSVKAIASDGLPTTRARIVWEITDGSGAKLSSAATVSDGTGTAYAYLTLGPVADTFRVRAMLANRIDEAVTFTAYAVPAPTITAVHPPRFEGGDTVAVRGSGLYDSIQVEIGGTLSRQLNASPNGDSMSIEVAPCLRPGTLEIQASIGSASSNTVVGTYESSQEPLSLAVGEYVSIHPGAADGCARLAAAGVDGAEYLATVQWMDISATRELAFRLSTDPFAPPVIPSISEPMQFVSASRFDEFLRSQERELAALDRSEMPQTRAAAAEDAPVNVGDKRTFRVCGKLDCSAPEDFPVVQAVAKYVGEHAVIYQDATVPSGGLTQQDFDELGSLFDDDLYRTATRAFGAESDLDGNNTVLILFTPWVNALTPKFGLQCAFSFVTGFFFSRDIDPLAAQDERSNQAEIFYAMVPDPEGEVSCPHTMDRVRTLVPVTFVHEFQHMISFYQHVILRGGESEESWLNEGLSHLAEELAAQHFRALGDEDRFNDYQANNLTNSYRFLNEPSSSAPIFKVGVGTVEERGAAWLFLSWLVDRHGVDVTRRLVETALTGIENLESAVGKPMERLLREWFLANYVSDLPGFPAPEELKRVSWSLRDAYRWLHEYEPGRFPYPFPLRPLSFSASAVDVTGSLVPGAGDLFRIVQSPGEAEFQFLLSDLDGNPLGGEDLPWLSLIRIR